MDIEQMPNTGKPVLFIYTNSFDLSADTLIQRLGNDAVFRFNVDLWQEYAVDIDRHRFVIANQAGRRVESANVAKFLWRKPYTHQQLYPDDVFPQELVFKEEELTYAMREVWNAMYYSGRAVLIDPYSDIAAGKLLQAQIAERYFAVPDWRVVCGAKTSSQGSSGKWVAKSLTSRRTGQRSMLFTTRVEADQLSVVSPWFLQSYIAAEYDVTVVVIRDALFTFALARGNFPEGVIDWRRARILKPEQDWVQHQLPSEVANGIRRFMKDMCLHYGRFDFLLAGGTYYFLEVNPNGEWGWLDPSGNVGIVDTLERELSPNTPCHALPNPRVIRVEDCLIW
jgi:hypothetical protein